MIDQGVLTYLANVMIAMRPNTASRKRKTKTTATTMISILKMYVCHNKR